MYIDLGKAVIYAAKFNAERYWEPSETIKLPSISNKNLDNMVAAFDEINYAFCKSGDYVLTSIAMDKAHLSYLDSLGFSFHNVPVFHDLSKLKEGRADYKIEDFDELEFSSGARLSTYAVTDEYIQLSEKYGFSYEHPDIETIKKVNSKKYSTILAKELDCNDFSYLINDTEQLITIGKKLLETCGGVMVKEEYGVSGKGNTKITELKALQRLRDYCLSQSKKGKKLSLILEPFFTIQTDFSVQYRIDKSGKSERISIQKVLNNQSTYNGSVNLDDELTDRLISEGYFSIMEKTCDRLYSDGYYGDICIDSMILADGRIVPIVEINARKSMSLIKHYLEQRISPAEDNKLTCSFYVDLTCHGQISFDDILNEFMINGILYTDKKKEGVIPLTANTLFINRILTDRDSYKGRLYFMAVTQPAGMDAMIRKTRDICSRFSL